MTSTTSARNRRSGSGYSYPIEEYRRGLVAATLSSRELRFCRDKLAGNGLGKDG